MDLFVIATGIWGFSGTILWSFARSRRAMLIVSISTVPGFVLHWALQGLWTASLMNSMTLSLAIISYWLDGPPGSRGVRVARSLYLAALVPIAIATALTWTGWPSLFAAMGCAISCIGRWQTDARRYRATMLLCSVPWFIHDILVWSLPALAADLFGMGRAAYLAAQTRGWAWRRRVHSS